MVMYVDQDTRCGSYQFLACTPFLLHLSLAQNPWLGMWFDCRWWRDIPSPGVRAVPSIFKFHPGWAGILVGSLGAGHTSAWRARRFRGIGSLAPPGRVAGCAAGCAAGGGTCQRQASTSAWLQGISFQVWAKRKQCKSIFSWSKRRGDLLRLLLNR